MTGPKNSSDVARNPTPDEARRMGIGLAAAQTAFELNNGFGIIPGKPLHYFDDSALVNTPGARPFKAGSLDGFVVQDVFNDPKTGLNAFLAYNKQTGEVLISAAGTNGFGKDRPDTYDDLVRMGTHQSGDLSSKAAFQTSLETAISEIGGQSALQKVLIAGQSLAGGFAPVLGLDLVYGRPGSGSEIFYRTLGITPDKIFVTSLNGFGDEYNSRLAGYSYEQLSEFRSQAALNRLVVRNIFTGEYDFVSQLGGKFSGTDWILDVEVAKGLGPTHRFNFGGAEGIDNKYGDLTLLRSGTVPTLNHESITRNLNWLDSNIPIDNNPVSMSWAGYVAMLFSSPGESSAGISKGLQSFAGLSKPVADVIGGLAETVLRIYPFAHAVDAIRFLAGAYAGGRLIGSSQSPQPVFDLEKAFGPLQQGWVRVALPSGSNTQPELVKDMNPETGVTVLKRLDGKSVEFHPDETQIQTDPEFGVAVWNPGRGGTLFLKGRDPVNGDAISAAVSVAPGSSLALESDGWHVRTLVDAESGLYQSTIYRGMEARLSELQVVPDNSRPDRVTVRETAAIIRQIPENSLDLPNTVGLQSTAFRIAPDHVQLVMRDDDRRTIQTIDVVSGNHRSETTYRDGQGHVQKVVKIEQLNAEATRTTILGEDGVLKESTVVQRYRRNGELYELEDRIDAEEGFRTLTVRDSQGFINRAEALPIDAPVPAGHRLDAIRDQLDNDIADFLTALRQKDTAGVILSTARIALDYARSQGMVTAQYDTLVGDLSGGLALVNSLHSIQSGDTLAKIGGTVGLLNSTNYFAGRLTGSGYLTGAQATALSQIGAVLAIANLANLGKMLEAGQVGSAGATIVGAINAVGYLTSASSALMGAGAVIAINPIALVALAFAGDTLFGEDPPPPPPQGVASFYRDSDGALRYRFSESNRLGEKILSRELDQLLPKLEQQLAAANAYLDDPAHRLNLVVSRMPTVQISAWPSYSNNGVDNYFFVMKQADPLRDEPSYAAVARQDLVKLYAETLLLPEAVVQQWEVDHLRAKFGNDEANWMTAGEWQRGRSPTEQQRAQLQAEVDRTTAHWKAASTVQLALSSLLENSNVSAQALADQAIAAARASMEAATAAADAFNEVHPVDPLQAARATPEQEAAFARSHAARETVSLQWIKLLAVDLGNDGVQVIDLPGEVGSDLDSLRTQRVARFDADGDGFLEATQWIAPADLILGIDRSGNGLIDSGSELFNGADTPFDQQGFASLRYYDANGDGLITQDDPVYRQLRLWMDLDADGSAGQLEVFDLQMRAAASAAASGADMIANESLAAMAVQAIDLTSGTLKFADGSAAPIVQLDLLAHTKGLQVAMDGATGNLNVLHEDGLRENFITLVDDMAALQELQSPTLGAARRAELEVLAARYGLNPSSEDFAGIVQGLRASGQALGTQDTVLYFGDDDVWVDRTLRERLEQMRISFRKLGDPSEDATVDPQLVHVGRPLQSQSINGSDIFDDRWVPSRKLGANDIRSDLPPPAPLQDPVPEQQAVPSDVYSLLAVTKGAQLGGLVTQTAVVSSDPAAMAPTVPQATVFSTAQPVAKLAPLSMASDEDSVVTLGYQQLAQEARVALAPTDPTIRLQLIGIRSARHGTVSMDDIGGRLSYTPQKDFAGQAGFTYVLADQTGRIYEREVLVSVQDVNDAPLTAGESIASSEDVPLLIDTKALLANDRDLEGDSLSVTGIARVALGRAELLGNGMIHYTPPSDQYGVTDILEYVVSDSRGASSIAKVRISLAAVDDAPSVVAERIINAREDQVLRITPRLLLRNDFDVDVDARLGSLPLKITAVGSAEHGRIRMDEGGEVVFTPDANFNGETHFSYTVMDDTGLATTGRATLRIDPVNDAPLAADEHIDSHEDEPLLIDPNLLLKNELDADLSRGEKQKLSVIAVNQAVGGSAQLKDGLIVFTPDADRSGSAGFRYLVSDGAGGMAEANVSISLAEVNDAPRLPGVRLSALEDTELLLPASRLLAGATDVDGEAALLKLTGVGNPTHGTLSLSGDQIWFRPAEDFAGTASFEYTVADALGAETTAIATIDVNGINDAPVGMAGSRFDPVGNEDQEIRIAESSLARMFWDADGDVLTIDAKSLKALNAGDSLRFDEARRELVFRAAPNVNGARQFRFAVTDGQVSSAPMAINVNLRPVNDAPVVNAIGFQMLEDGGATDPTQSAWSYLSHSLLLSGASDIEGDAVQVVRVSGARTTGVKNPQPVEVINDELNRRIAIRAPINYNGAMEFEFTVSDGNGGETVQKAYGSVVPVNDAPYLTAQQTTTPANRRIRGQEVLTWNISAWDPDDQKALLMQAERNPLRGDVDILGKSVFRDIRGGVNATLTIISKSGAGNVTTTETAWFSATDSAGAKSQISISFTGRYRRDPIVIDLGRDGLNFVDIADSRASFDIDGTRRRSAWVGSGEGILAYDFDRDGHINRIDEIAFGSHVGNPALSDLQALQQSLFDQNQDGIFDANDTKWNEFVLWQDKNGNGSSDDGELRSLPDAGIKGLYLNANVLNRAEGANVRVRGYTRVMMDDGSLLQAADVWLGLDNPDQAAGEAPDPSMQQVSLLGADQLASLLKQLADAPQDGNRAPLVYGYLPTQFADEGQPFRLEIAPNFFIDADTADPLRIDARMADGSALPSWLHWNPERLLFEGTPGHSDAGKLQLALTATDHQGASSSVSFTLVTTETNLAPTVNQPLETIGWKTSSDNTLHIPATLFVDPNKDDALLHRVTLADGSALPSWMNFDEASATLSGKPDDGQLRTPVSLKITATDLGGLTVSTVASIAAAHFGTEGNDRLEGAVADEYLWGEAGNDVLVGGAGNDTLIGGSGNDVYLFERRFGADTIIEQGSNDGTNTIRFGTRISDWDVDMYRDHDSLYISVYDTLSSDSDEDQSRVTIRDFYKQPDTDVISSIEFANGTIWKNLREMRVPFAIDLTAGNHVLKLDEPFDYEIYADEGNQSITTSSGNDQIYCEGGNDTVDGGAGNDVLVGGAGSDTYVFNPGWGWDTIEEVTSSSDHNVIRFGGGIRPADLLLSRSMHSLVITERGSDNRVSISSEGDWRPPSWREGLVSEIQFANGEVWTALSDRDIAFNGVLDWDHPIFTGSIKDDVIQATWKSSIIHGDEGNDAILGDRGNDQLFGDAGNDTLYGGTGNDTLYGGIGNDLYDVAGGKGSKTITEIGGIDTLKFDDVVSIRDLSLSRSGLDLLAGFQINGGSVTVKDFFRTDGSVNTEGGIDWFRFSGDRLMSAAALAGAMATSTAGATTSILPLSGTAR